MNLPVTDSAPGARRFGPSTRALKQRRWLVLLFKLVLTAIVVVALQALEPKNETLALIVWLAAALAGARLWTREGALVLDPIRRKQVLLHEAVLELSRGGYRRFVVFEGLKHIQAVQDAGEHIIEIRLHTADDSVLIRDVEGLGEIFAAVCAAKPAGVLVEVAEKKVDWGEPLPWVISLGLSAFLALGLAWSL